LKHEGGRIRIYLSVPGLAMVFGSCFGLTHQLPFLFNAIVFSGLFKNVLGLTYNPSANGQNQKIAFGLYSERYKNPSLVKSEGKKVLRIGLACFISGLGLGLLTFHLLASPQGQASVNNGNMWFFIFLVIAVLLFISGFILTWLGFVWSRIDMYKQLKKNGDN
jgi:hypothetical protein